MRNDEPPRGIMSSPRRTTERRPSPFDYARFTRYAQDDTWLRGYAQDDTWLRGYAQDDTGIHRSTSPKTGSSEPIITTRSAIKLPGAMALSAWRLYMLGGRVRIRHGRFSPLLTT